ncbi:MAG: hypothetical protein ACYC7A_09245 [Thermoanaerobaculia bacterium]
MRPILIAATIFACATSVFAWTPAAEQRIATKATQLSPPDLRFLIEKHNDAFLEGIAAAAREDVGENHRYYPNTNRGKLRLVLKTEVQQTINSMKRPSSTRVFVERLGRIAHLVGDANNPFHADNFDPRLEGSRDDYERYLERRMTVFPTVFYGLELELQFDRYLDSMFARSAHLYPLVAQEYFRTGARRSSAEFDDRSTAFGIASVSYSRAVSDLVNIYYYIWKESGGDVRTAPVLKSGNLLLNETISTRQPLIGGTSKFDRR